MGTVGTGTGAGALAIFEESTDFLPTSTITTLSDGNGTAVFNGNVNITNIAASERALASLQFTGSEGQIGVGGDVYSKEIKFNTNTLNVTDNASLNGATTTEGDIVLNNNNITLANGVSTWDAETPILSTTFIQDGEDITLGTMTIAEDATLNITNPVQTIAIADNIPVNINGTYTLIPVHGTLNGEFIGEVTSNQAFDAYTVKRDANNNIVITRTDIASVVITDDLNNAGGLKIVGTNNVSAFTNPNNMGAAVTALTNFGNMTSEDRAKAVEALIAEDSNTTTIAENVSSQVMEGLYDRLGPINYLGGNNSPASGDDDYDHDTSYRKGAWIKPFYAQSDQKMGDGVVAGYKARTKGALIGFDTTINDNLTLGAAIGLTDTRIKYKNYKSGDKTNMKGASFTLYGAKQLTNNFFVQAVATYAKNRVKDTSNRYSADADGALLAEVATGRHNNKTYGGEVLIGYDAKPMEKLLFTPMIGARYLKSKDNSYKEVGAGVLNKNINNASSYKWDGIIGARAIGLSMKVKEAAILPELHAFVTRKINGKTAKIQSKLDGQVDYFTGQADSTAKTFYNVGVAVTAIHNTMEYGIGYDAYLSKKYIGRQGTLKVRLNF